MAENAIVSEDMAKKFASEKDSPYVRWVRGEGLDIISAHYIADLNTVLGKLRDFITTTGRVPFALGPEACATEASAVNFAAANKFVAPAVAVPASEVKKNLRRDHKLMHSSTMTLDCEAPLYTTVSARASHPGCARRDPFHFPASRPAAAHRAP